jgi:peptide-methionine (R)-S-oxide reductase
MKIISLASILMLLFCNNLNAQESNTMNKKVLKTDDEWKDILTPSQYYILREKGTDRPGDYGYTNHFEKGTYVCTACDTQLFESNSKYESHCGWPSFDDAISGKVEFVSDTSLGMIRTEIICATCNGHLGHIFDDGPKETTGKRYCVNSTSITFVKSKD